MSATVDLPPAARERQPKTLQDPLDPREVSTTEAPPQGWSTGLRVRRHR
jgi:hypothetical protein